MIATRALRSYSISTAHAAAATFAAAIRPEGYQSTELRVCPAGEVQLWATSGPRESTLLCLWPNLDEFKAWAASAAAT
jgi:hypothetical protein